MIDPKLIELDLAPLKSDFYVHVYNHNKTIVTITPYVSDLLVVGGYICVIEDIKRKLTEKFEMSDMGDVSLALRTQFTRNRENGTLTITHEEYTKSIIARFGMEKCKPVNTPGSGSELSTEQQEETLLNDEETQRSQAITDSARYPAQITRFIVMYASYQLARAMSKPAKVHMGAAKHLLRYLAETTAFNITCKRGGFKLTAFSGANCGNKQENGKSTGVYGPCEFQVGNSKTNSDVYYEGITHG